MWHCAATINWEPRSKRLNLARWASYNDDRSLTLRGSLSMQELINRVVVVHKEAAQRLFELNREKDMLTHALGNKEHPRYTRGVGVVPWKIAFEDESLLLAFKDPVNVGLAIG